VTASQAELVELRRLRLPLVAPFAAAHGTVSVRDVLVVRVVTPDAEGWGECAALPEPTYSPEYVDGAADVIERFLAPRLFDGAGWDDVAGHRMAKAAVEGALLDAGLRAQGVSLAAWLGGVRARVPAGVALGLGASVEDVGRFVEAGYGRVKLKIAPGADVEPVRRVREAFPDVALQVDANGSYGGVDDAGARLAGLDPFGLQCIEQPLADDDLLGHAALARAVRTPICLDESITSAAAARQAIDLGACAVVNVKPGRVGGVAEARRVHDVCVAAGVPAWMGGMLETGIGRAVNVAVASLPGFTLPGDLSASSRYFAEDVTEPFVLVDGGLDVPTGPGIGVSPRPEALARFTTSVRALRPS